MDAFAETALEPIVVPIEEPAGDLVSRDEIDRERSKNLVYAPFPHVRIKWPGDCGS